MKTLQMRKVILGAAASTEKASGTVGQDQEHLSATSGLRTDVLIPPVSEQSSGALSLGTGGEIRVDLLPDS